MSAQLNIKNVSTAILLAAVGAISGCSGSKAAEKEKERLPTVQVTDVGLEDIADILRYSVDLKPYADVKIFSPVPDRILYFPWEDGQEIKSGERVALIRKEGLEHGLEQVVAQMEALDVQLKNLEAELQRSRELFERGVISQQMLDKVETQYKSTAAQRKALEASRGQLAATASNAVITAPLSGVIANKTLEKGDMAVPQVPLCRIVAIDKLKATLQLIEEDATKVRVGQQVKLHLDAYPERVFEGRVTTVLPYLDPQTRTNGIEVTVDNPREEGTNERVLKPGMFGTAELIVEMREQVVAAPEPALLLDSKLLADQGEGEMLRKAFVIDEERIAHERLVRLGARKGSLFEIKEGLAAGERIVVRGQHGLDDGQKVEIVERTDS